MYAVLEWTVSTGEDIVSDISAVLCGETNPNNLSASANKPNCSITNTYFAAGWTMHDNQTGDKVIKAPLVDDGATYKFVRFQGTGGYQYTAVANLYRLWDSGTHTGTDQTENVYIPGPAYLATPRVFISASVRHCLFFGHDVGVGDINESCGVFEFRRTSPWDTVAYGATKEYIPAVIGNSWHTMGDGGKIPAAVREYDQVRVTGANFAVANPYGSGGDVTNFGTSFSMGRTWAWVLGTLTESYKLGAIGVGGVMGLPFHEVSTLAGGVWYLTPGWKNHLAEFVHPEDGRTYVCMQVNGTVAMAVPKG